MTKKHESPGTILVVDDTPASISMVRAALEDAKYRVLVAISGEKALQRIRTEKPDIILLDILMPGIDGYETCRRLKADTATREIPVIFLSALTDTFDKVKAFELGAVDYLIKPMAQEELLARVHTHLSISRLERELQKANNELELRVEQRTAELAATNARLKEEIEVRKRAEEEILQKKDELYKAYEELTAFDEELKANFDELSRVEKELRLSEEYYRILFENTGTATVIIEADTTISLSNTRFGQLTGYPRAELEGRRSWTEFVIPEDLARMKEQHRLRRDNREKALTQYEFRLVSRSGEIRHIFLSIDMIPGTTKSVASLMDITDRKKAEEEREMIHRWQAGVNRILASILAPVSLDAKMKVITDGVVETFGADFCRIWLTGMGDRCSTGCMHAGATEGPHVCRIREKCLHLRASSGRYTHTDGKAHARVPFGAYKIGLIASGDEAQFLTNDVEHEPRVHDHAWAKSLGLVGFAGYSLRPPDGEVLGVFALFTRFPITPDMDAILEGLSRAISLVVQKDTADRTLLESERKLQGIVSGSPIPQFVLDEHHRVISWNAALEEASGVKAADVLGTTDPWKAFYPAKRPVIADLLVDDTPEKVPGWYAGKFSRSKYIEGAYEATDFFPHAGKTGLWLYFTASAIRNDEGRIIGAVETLEDITEKKKAEDALMESEERFRALYDENPSMYFTLDPEGTVLSVNQFGAGQLGYTVEELVGRPVLDIFYPADRVAVLEHLNLCLNDIGKSTLWEFRKQKKDGTLIWVRETVRPVRGADGNIVVLVICEDITEAKMIHLALGQATNKLNVLNAITFSDIQNAIFSLSGYLQIQKTLPADEKSQQYTDKEIGLVRTISDSLKYATIFQNLGLKSPVWQNVGQSFLMGISHLDISKLSRKLDVGNLEIYADPMLENVFFSLADNVLQHAKTATAYSLSCTEMADGLILAFEDNGPGIPDDLKEKVFDREYGRRKGIGLYLSREVLSITGISIRETGEPGKGARFEIIVPKGAYRCKDQK